MNIKQKLSFKSYKYFLLVLFLLILNIKLHAQCPVNVYNALDCEINIQIKAYDCNGNLLESVSAILLPGNWHTPKLTIVPTTHVAWCKCGIQGSCYKYKIFYNNQDITGKITCCPQCDPAVHTCVKACCAVFDFKCIGGVVTFTSEEPPCCIPPNPPCP